MYLCGSAVWHVKLQEGTACSWKDGGGGAESHKDFHASCLPSQIKSARLCWQ